MSIKAIAGIMIRGIRASLPSGVLIGRVSPGQGAAELIDINDVIPSVPVGANPTATAGPTAINGSAATFMRSDAAPAIQKASASQFGIVEVDNTTITATSGVISAVQPSVPVGSNPTATAGPTAINGSAATFLRSDGAPAIQKASASQFGIVEVDNTTITASGGVISAVGGGATGANPTATAGPIAINGSAATFLRSDGAPAVQLASSAQFGIVEVDGVTILAAAGVIRMASIGLLPLVNGDTPGPALIATADGQCIGVPQ